MPILLVLAMGYFLINNIAQHYKQDIKLLNTYLVNDGKTLFDNMIITRAWNAEHESVYVENSSLKPNPYLENNTIQTADNVTLVKVNAAWMTRQISEVANLSQGYFYKITSLKPKNPNNKPDSFEEEALKYFEKNKNQKYYYKLPDLEGEDKYFNFMGSLKVEKKCLSCHDASENTIGGIRGGISVSIPLEIYKNTYKHITEYKRHNEIVVITFVMISLIAIIFSVLYFMKNQEKIKKLNLSLRKKVAMRTQELYELNKDLEIKIQDAVNDVKEKEKLMISQAKNAVMGEMLAMIAHQWRQPLNELAMINNNIVAEIVLHENESEDIKKYIEISFDVLEHLSKTIDDFAGFFKPTKIKERFMISDILRSTLEMLGNILHKNGIQVIVGFTEDIEINTYKRELLHVILNILNNSKDAFIDNDIDVSKRIIDIRVSKDMQIVTIKICDSAGGIKEENIDKVFDPYFSTKAKNGTGLGLYMSRVIVEKHIGGKISVYNFSDGVCFEIKIHIDDKDER